MIEENFKEKPLPMFPREDLDSFLSMDSVITDEEINEFLCTNLGYQYWSYVSGTEVLWKFACEAILLMNDNFIRLHHYFPSDLKP